MDVNSFTVRPPSEQRRQERWCTILVPASQETQAVGFQSKANPQDPIKITKSKKELRAFLK
jgi:hypothetical protein